jgi:hypothetical protein
MRRDISVGIGRTEGEIIVQDKIGISDFARYSLITCINASRREGPSKAQGHP